MAGHGMDWLGEAWHGWAWLGLAWHGKVKLKKHGAAWRGVAWRGMAWHGEAWIILTAPAPVFLYHHINGFLNRLGLNNLFYRF